MDKSALLTRSHLLKIQCAVFEETMAKEEFHTDAVRDALTFYSIHLARKVFASPVVRDDWSESVERVCNEALGRTS